jgi:hypothetical protein
MQLTNTTDHCAPVEISAAEAAKALMDKRHLVLIGPRGGRQEKILGRIAASAAPLPCRYMVVSARYAPHLQTPVIGVGSDSALLEHLVIFLLDCFEARAAVIQCFVSEVGIRATEEMFSGARPGIRGPILMMGGESEAETEKLQRDYALVLNVLQDLHEGRAIDASLN